MTKVLKFGGTSVGSAKNMKQVASIVTHEGATITVLSAMSGTTDALVKIVALASAGNMSETEELISMLRQKYETCINELLNEHKADGITRMETTLALIRHETKTFREYLSERIIIAQGELLTSAIFAMYMQECGHKTILLNAPDFMHKDESGKVDTALLAQQLNAQIDPSSNTYYITQGFICTNHNGDLDNLGRGGSDYSAALMGAAIHAGEVQIWTDIDGMHNNDPRFVENTYPIHRMSFDEAAELAYFGAKILHPATIQPCKDQGIPV